MEVGILGPNDTALLDAATRVFRGFGQRADAAILTDPCAVVLVAVEDETVLGWAWAYELPRPTGGSMLVLYGLEVADGGRSRGVGRALLDRFAALAAERGHVTMWMLADVEEEVARRLYAGAGGRPAGEPGSWWVSE